MGGTHPYLPLSWHAWDSLRATYDATLEGDCLISLEFGPSGKCSFNTLEPEASALQAENLQPVLFDYNLGAARCTRQTARDTPQNNQSSPRPRASRA